MEKLKLYYIRLCLFIMAIAYQKPVFSQEQCDANVLNDTVQLTMDSIAWNDTIPDVVVIGDSVFRYVDKDLYLITKEMRRNCNNTGEVLGKIPGLHYSRFDKSLSYYGDKNLVILVDSVEKNSDYIKRLHHLRFDKVEIIPSPKGQYSDYDVVINLHRVPDYEGYENNAYASEQLMPSALDNKYFDATDWSNSFTFTKNKWNVNLNYNGNFYQRGLAAYGDVIYMPNDYKESIIPNVDNGSNNGNYARSNSLSFATDYQINRNHSLSLLYKYDNENNDAYANRTMVVSDISETYHDTVHTYIDNGAKGSVQSLGLYYRGVLSKWNYNLTFNYVNHTWDSKYYVGRTSGFRNRDNRHQRMNHTFSKVDVNRNLVDYKLYFASSYTYFWRKYDQYRSNTNLSLSNSTLTYHNLWTSLSYNIAKTTGVSVSGTATFYESDAGTRKSRYSTYTGALGFVSTINKLSQIRFTYSCNSSNPRLDQLSSYGFFTDSLIWTVGNPDLKASLSHNLELRYRFFAGLSFTSKLSWSPRNFVSVISSQRGTLQNGVESNYAIIQEQNGKHLYWVNNLNIEKSLGNYSLMANIGYSYLKSEFSGVYKDIGAWNGNCEFTYELAPSEIYLTALYKIINSYTLSPQSIVNERYDAIGFSINKAFCKDKIELSLSYVSPLHFISTMGRRLYTTPAFSSKMRDESKYHVNNTIFISFSYNLVGGKSIRKYKREMSEEK